MGIGDMVADDTGTGHKPKMIIWRRSQITRLTIKVPLKVSCVSKLKIDEISVAFWIHHEDREKHCCSYQCAGCFYPVF